MEQTIDPDHVGFDAKRLGRIQPHFATYVDDGRLAGWHIVVTRCGQVAYSEQYGVRDLSTGAPVESDTLWRIYSMTKAVTSVAAMMLFEEGQFELTDPISRWLPAFADMRVYTKGSLQAPVTVPATEPIRVWHLLSHTSGLTYGFLQESVVDGLYRAAGFDLEPERDLDLATAVDEWARLPLLFQPGSKWGYSVATDVLGRLRPRTGARPRPRHRRRRVGPPAAAVPAGLEVGLQRRHRRARPARRGDQRADP